MNRLPAGREVREEPTMVATGASPAADEVFQRALEAERRLNVQRVGWLSFAIISAFFALYLFLGVVLGIHYWAGLPRLFGVYWVLVVAFLWAGLRWDWVGRHASLSIPLIHMPMVFLLISDFLGRETDPSGPGASRSMGAPIVVSDATRRLVGDAVRFVPAGPAQLRGRAEVVETYVPVPDVSGCASSATG